MLSISSLSIFILLLLLALSILALSIHRHLKNRKYRRLPPGPTPWPIIGNIHQLPLRDPWRKVHEWHQTYGPILTFWIGPVPVVVLSSLPACHEIFDRRGRLYSTRPQVSFVNQLNGGLQPFLFPYNKALKLHRQIYRVMLDPSATPKYRPREEAETCRLLHELAGNPDNQALILERFNPNLSSLMAYGDGGVLVDAIPALNHLPSFLSPWKKTADTAFRQKVAALGLVASHGLASDTMNWTRAVRALKQADDMSWPQFVYSTGELFEVSYMTSFVSLGVFLMICATHPQATCRAADELQRAIGSERLPGFDDLAAGRLPYLSAFIKEVQRWRPVAPLGAPRSVTEDDEFEGYVIPRGTTVVANIWAIHMDTGVFVEPEMFKPERICPGRHIFADVFAITVARLLWAFDMEPSVDPASIDASRSAHPGVIFRPVDVGMKFRVRSARHREAIERALGAVDD
ncbi:cytochrome P450 [Aspergillus multicolor]|uniref:cytochrome P450 n=1 Tax=Aspergillus multicolor TaxID=41759 RepID=UPI003CCD32FE